MLSCWYTVQSRYQETWGGKPFQASYHQGTNGFLHLKIRDKPEDIDAANLYEEIHNSWFSDAVFKSKYPESLLNILGDYMPAEYEGDLKIIGTPIDWLGINYYTRNLIKFDKQEKIFQILA